MTKKAKESLDIQELVASAQSDAAFLIQKKRENEQKVKDSLNTMFYFSVVFVTRKERDAWLKKHDLPLRDDEFIYASEIEPKMKA